MKSSGGVAVRRAAIAMVGFLLVVLASPSAMSGESSSGDDRSTTMPAQIRKTGVYLEASPAQGDEALWRRRLEAGVRKADLGAPVKVALWTEIEGVWPGAGLYDGNDASTLRKLNLPPRSIALLSEEPGFVLVEHALDGPVGERVSAWEDTARATVERIEESTPDAQRYPSLSSVARAWIHLRLAAADAPEPKKLIRELSGDVTLFDDAAGVAEPPTRPYSEVSLTDPMAILGGALVLLGTVGVFLVQTWLRPRATSAERVAAPRSRPDGLLTTLTPLALEEEVTDLSRRIARSDVRPGDRAYDAAQGCLDAAVKYVDSERDRDRFGVHLLVAEGRAELDGEHPRAKCFFHPMHTATTTVRREHVTLPCCLRCAKEVSAGSLPGALMVADDDGEVRPYYETEDVWTTTGYGAIDERWAKRALLEALRGRR